MVQLHNLVIFYDCRSEFLRIILFEDFDQDVQELGFTCRCECQVQGAVADYVLSASDSVLSGSQGVRKDDKC